ncbi:MAG: hypothetical protein M3R36_15430 [Bacteroidota bacterium]|nr:hypothetical protein [Bacteroidota bacterium]
MKSKIFCAFVFILIGNLSEAQEEKPKSVLNKNSEYWSLSYSVGFGGNINTNGYTRIFGNGFAYSIDASYTPENSLGFFAIILRQI